MAEYSDYNTCAIQEDGYYGQGSYPEQRHGGFSQAPHSRQQYGYDASRPYRGYTPSYSSYDEHFHHSRLSLDLESTHNDFKSDYNNELRLWVPESKKLDPQGRDADQERKDRKDAHKRRDRQEKERRDAEEKMPRNRVIEDPKGPRFGPQSPSQGTSKNESTKGVHLHCLFPGCEYNTTRQYDFERHMNTHIRPGPDQLLDYSGRGCGRVGEAGFTRKDHLREHFEKVYGKRIR